MKMIKYVSDILSKSFQLKKSGKVVRGYLETDAAERKLTVGGQFKARKTSFTYFFLA